MDARIISRTIDSVADQRIRLGNTAFVRSMDIGSTWEKIRLGMRFSMDPNGYAGNIFGYPRIYFGVCSGTTDVVGSRVPDHFLGIYTNTVDFVRASDIYGKFGTSNGLDSKPIRIVNGTSTEGSTTFSGGALSAVPDTKRAAYFVEIEKTSPNYSVTFYGPNNTGANVDLSLAGFFNTLETPGDMEGIANYTLSSTDTDLAINEGTNGSLNAVNVFWDRFAISMEVTDLAYAKFS